MRVRGSHVYHISIFHFGGLNPAYISAETCGTRPGLSPATLRIISGTKAKAGQYPWQVKFLYPSCASYHIDYGNTCTIFVGECFFWWILKSFFLLLLTKMILFAGARQTFPLPRASFRDWCSEASSTKIYCCPGRVPRAAPPLVTPPPLMKQTWLILIIFRLHCEESTLIPGPTTNTCAEPVW